MSIFASEHNAENIPQNDPPKIAFEAGFSRLATGRKAEFALGK